MYHCPTRGRGIRIRGDSPTNIIFTRDCSYQRMLEKCINQLGYSEAEKRENSFYIADSRGISICKSDTLCVEDKGSREKNIPWTLMSYIEYSNVRYPSKAKFYCVAKSKLRSLDRYVTMTTCFQAQNMKHQSLTMMTMNQVLA